MTGAERTRQWREKFRHDKPVTKPAGAEIAALTQELASAKARIRFLEDAITVLRIQKHAPAKPKAEKPPLPPDEERDRIIKGLRTRVQNLSRELSSLKEFYATKQGIMSRETRTAIDKVLHPDAHPTGADKDRAVKDWNAWKNDSDKVRRQGR